MSQTEGGEWENADHALCLLVDILVPTGKTKLRAPASGGLQILGVTPPPPEEEAQRRRA